MKKDRKELEEKLIKSIDKIKHQKKIVGDIQKHLGSKHKILAGDVMGYLNNAEKELPELDIRLLYLIAEQVYVKTEDQEINPENFFTQSEVKEARQYTGDMDREEELEFPITFRNVTVVGHNAYSVTMDIKTIVQLFSSRLLHYDFDLQREAKRTVRKDTVIIEPTTNKQNVKEIEEHLLDGTLVPTFLTFNANTRTSETGNELIYDAKKMELTITKGTYLAIVDGFHRITGSRNALIKNPNIDFAFGVLITNYSKSKAQKYQAQIAKATPISKVRQQELEASRKSDTVVQQLKEESDLKGRISQTGHIHESANELVAYNVLADTIDEEFKMETNADALDVADYLTKFFDYLIGSFADEFIKNVKETRKTSIISDNNMWAGYVVLARRLQEEGINYRKIKDIINNIDFERDSDLWHKIGVLEKGNLTSKARQEVKKYFRQVDIKELLGEGIKNGQ